MTKKEDVEVIKSYHESIIQYLESIMEMEGGVEDKQAKKAVRNFFFLFIIFLINNNNFN